MRPSRSIVVIPGNSDGRHPSVRKVPADARQLLEDPLVIAGEIAGERDDVGVKIGDPAKVATRYSSSTRGPM